MFRLLTIAIFRLYTNPLKVVKHDLIWAVYSRDVGVYTAHIKSCITTF